MFRASKSFASSSSTSLFVRSMHSNYVKATAKDIMNQSCYYNVDFKIHHSASVYDAIKRMAAINLGCLAVADDAQTITGIVSERDYLKKVELLGKSARNVSVSEIMTHRARIIVANEDELPNSLMAKMLSNDIRHLPVVNVDGDIVGMLSIKDIVREVNHATNADMEALTSFALGKGGHFVMD